MGKGGRGLADDSERGKLSRAIKTAVDVTKVRGGKLADTAEWVFGGRAARVLGVVALFVVVVALLLVFLNWYVAPTKPSEKKDLVLALAQILAGTAILSGLYFTWRTLQVNREGQITERFTQAIEQLGKTDNEGNKLFEIRVGGIYALERIARESEEDYFAIMEVLTAYVRQHARRMPEQKLEGAEEAAIEEQYKEDSREDSRGELETTGVPTLDPDIQAIMTVLRRRTHSIGHGEPEPLDLRGAHLSGADLSGANLRGAVLSGAVLSGAELQEADLSGAVLSGSYLTEAGLQEAVYTGADLSGAHLRGAELSGEDLSGADLSGADLSGADLAYVDLSGANLRGAELSRANLSRANLSGADLSEVILTGTTTFSGADLRGADLRGAVRSLMDLSEADIEGMGLKLEDLEGRTGRMVAEVAEGVKLKGPAQAGAELSLLEVLQAKLDEANGDANTQLPSGLKPPRTLGRENSVKRKFNFGEFFFHALG